MPFSSRFDVIYRKLIKPAAEESGVTPLRADDVHTPGIVYEQIRVAIQQARVCIADVSNSNPNLLYELGLAQALGKPIVLLAERGHELPFDIAQRRVIFYDLEDLDEAIIATEAALRAVLQHGRLETAERLIDAGAYRGAMAELGVTMEFVLMTQVALGIAREFTKRYDSDL
jgi:nucleoside 2-deoxyribosyltransferase